MRRPPSLSPRSFASTPRPALVEALGSALTSLDEELRRCGTRCSATSPRSSRRRRRCGEHLQVAVAFFADRLGDYLTIGPAIEALSAATSRRPRWRGPRIATTLLEECDAIAHAGVAARRHDPAHRPRRAHRDRGGRAHAGAGCSRCALDGGGTCATCCSTCGSSATCALRGRRRSSTARPTRRPCRPHRRPPPTPSSAMSRRSPRSSRRSSPTSITFTPPPHDPH